jgi:hypothetical protein
MNLLPIFALGVGAYFLTKKKPVTSSSSTIKNDSKIGSKDIGYEIINCNTVKIYNEQKAFQYAFALGSSKGMIQKANELESNLIGDCFEQLEGVEEKDAIAFAKKFFKNKTIVRFIFNLFRFAYSGYTLTSPDNAQNSINALVAIKESFTKIGIDTTDLQTDLVVEMPKI